MKPTQKKRPKYLNPGTVNIIKQVLLGLLVLSCVAILITAIWYATRIKSLTIDTVTVSGGITISDEMVKSKINEQLEGAYLRLIPKRFSFFYPEEDVFSSVQSIERIKNVQIEKKSNKAIHVSFNEYMPDNLWCSYEDKNDCYFIDNDGYSFARSPSLTGGSLIRYYLTSSNSEINKLPLSAEDYNITKDFTDKLAEIGWYVTRVEVDAVRDVFYTMARGSELKATLTDGFETPFSNLETILQSKEFKHLEPGNFQYVDLRFGTRVFVNEELLLSVSSSTATTTEVNEEAVGTEVLAPAVIQ